MAAKMFFEISYHITASSAALYHDTFGMKRAAVLLINEVCMPLLPSPWLSFYLSLTHKMKSL